MDEDTKQTIDTNKENLARVIGFVNVMDGKAKFVLTLVLALTGYLVTQLGSYADAHARWATMPNWAPTCFIILDLTALACLTCFTATAIIVIQCIRPRTKRHTGKTSPLFFATIAEMPHEEFKVTMQLLTPNQIIDCLADQTYDNAKIVQQKTTNVQLSFTLFLSGLVCFLAFTIGRPIIMSLAGR